MTASNQTTGRSSPVMSDLTKQTPVAPERGVDFEQAENMRS